MIPRLLVVPVAVLAQVVAVPYAYVCELIRLGCEPVDWDALPVPTSGRERDAA